MESGLVMGIAIAVVSGSISFVVGRWLSRKRRGKKAESELLAARAAQSRQVRRAGERRGRR
jgi:type II secretory pathway pseudopilin PulG